VDVGYEIGVFGLTFGVKNFYVFDYMFGSFLVGAVIVVVVG